MKNFMPAPKRIDMSVGESVRVVRELQELSQTQLAEIAGIPVADLADIENDVSAPNVEQAKALARALRCHPAVLFFPGWSLEQQPA